MLRLFCSHRYANDAFSRSPYFVALCAILTCKLDLRLLRVPFRVCHACFSGWVETVSRLHDHRPTVSYFHWKFGHAVSRFHDGCIQEFIKIKTFCIHPSSNRVTV